MANLFQTFSFYVRCEHDLNLKVVDLRGADIIFKYLWWVKG